VWKLAKLWKYRTINHNPLAMCQCWQQGSPHCTPSCPSRSLLTCIHLPQILHDAVKVQLTSAKQRVLTGLFHTSYSERVAAHSSISDKRKINGQQHSSKSMSNGSDMHTTAFCILLGQSISCATLLCVPATCNTERPGQRIVVHNRLRGSHPALTFC